MSTSYIERIEISNPQRLKSYTELCFFSLLVTCQVQFGAFKIYFIRTHSCWYLLPIYRANWCFYQIYVLLQYQNNFGLSFTPYFNPISKETSTESNEADEIYLLSRTKKLYIIFQHIDNPFYLKFWMQCMSYIKTISTL